MFSSAITTAVPMYCIHIRSYIIVKHAAHLLASNGETPLDTVESEGNRGAADYADSATSGFSLLLLALIQELYYKNRI